MNHASSPLSWVVAMAVGLLLGLASDAGAQESRLANLAIRAEAAAGEPLIVGFNVGAGAEKTVLIRAVGPTLGIFGVPSPLADPRLELFASDGRKIGENDNHVAADAPVFTQVGAFALTAGSKDAAIVARLGGGGYTVHVTGAAGTRGTMLVEVYEVGGTGTPLTNLSARAKVGTGDAILIPGLVLSPGATSRRLLMRAVGPGLEPFGVTGLLSNPRLELFQGGTRIAENDDWGTPTGLYAASADALSDAFRRSGAFALPAGSRDAAIYTTLPPGGYTLQVSGVGGRTGEALVEVYDLTGQPEPPVQLASSLYFTTLRPAASATSSTASGFASITFNAEGVALVNARLSNLSSAQTSAYLRVAGTGDYLLALPAGQISQREWRIDAVGAYSRNDILRALNEGRIYLSVGSARFPDGEVTGTMVSSRGSQTFVTPPEPPALAASALAQPDAVAASRFLTQATFGSTLASIDEVRRVGIREWIRAQQALPATSLLALVREDATRFPPPEKNPDGMEISRIDFYFTHNVAWWKLALASPDQLRQRVAFALSQIFVIAAEDTNRAEPMAQYYDVLAQEAFGNFRTLLERVTLHPEMAWYLTFLRNQKADPVKGTSPDENYAREIQQLFTIGLVQLQPDGTLLLDSQGLPIPTYDNRTITETAKVFTGWAYRNRNNNFYSDPAWSDPGGFANSALYSNSNGRMQPLVCYEDFHDRTEKRVISLEQRPPREATPTIIPAGLNGADDLRILLDALFRHPNTGPFICRQLIQRLVTSNPSPGYVHRVAKVFADNGNGIRGDLGAVVTAILTDYEARAPEVAANVGFGKVKEPLLRTTALLRVLNTQAPNGRYADSYYGDPRGSFYPVGFFAGAGNSSYSFGQALFRSPSVFNFYSPTYSAPGPLADAGLVAPEMQITDSNLSIRTPNRLTELINLQPPDESKAPTPSPFMRHDFGELLAVSAEPATLIDRLNLLFCGGQMTTLTKKALADVIDATSVVQTLANSPTPAKHAANTTRWGTQLAVPAASAAAFDPKGSFTMEGWFHPVASVGQWGAWLMGKRGNFDGDPWAIYQVSLNGSGSGPDQGKVTFVVATGGRGSGSWLSSPSALPVGRWSHVAAVLDGLTMRLYVNGVEVAQRAASGPPLADATARFSIGGGVQGDGPGGAPNFDGSVAQVRFWNVARSAAQLAQGMNEPQIVERTGLVAGWLINEGQGTTVPDYSGNGHHLATPRNQPWLPVMTWVPADGTGLERVQSALHLVTIAPDAALQR
jgi:uncharacterized protein (DUF1800 family)